MVPTGVGTDAHQARALMGGLAQSWSRIVTLASVLLSLFCFKPALAVAVNYPLPKDPLFPELFSLL